MSLDTENYHYLVSANLYLPGMHRCVCRTIRQLPTNNSVYSSWSI